MITYRRELHYECDCYRLNLENHNCIQELTLDQIDARTKVARGKEYELKHRDALEIVTR